MNSSAKPTDPEGIETSLNRLHELLQSSSFTDEAERLDLLNQLQVLKEEVSNHEDALPDSFHEALRHAEGYAVNRLVNSANDDSDSDITDMTWGDVGHSIEKAVETWEAKHPKLATAFMDFTNVLSKLGI